MQHPFKIATAHHLTRSETWRDNKPILTFRASVAILLLTFIQACSTTPEVELPEEVANLENLTVIPADAEAEQILTPEKVAVFGETEDVLIGWIRSVAVDSLGRVFIADDSRNVIHVFNSEGSYLTRVGREGDGPGEFRGITQIRTDSRFLYAKDASSLKITRFDLQTLEYMDAVSFPFDIGGGGGYSHFLDTFYLMGPDHYLIQFSVGYVAGLVDSGQKQDIEGWLFNRESGEYEGDMVFSFRDSETLYRRSEDNIHVMEPPYMRTSNIMRDHTSRIVYGWSENILFTVHDLNGNAVEAIYKPHENVMLNQDDVYKIYEDQQDPWKTMIREDEFPERWPAYGQAVVDDHGRIWVALFTEDVANHEWIILDRSGSLSASFKWPRNRNVQLIRDGFIYTLERNPDTGVQKIVKYGFDL